MILQMRCSVLADAIRRVPRCFVSPATLAVVLAGATAAISCGSGETLDQAIPGGEPDPDGLRIVSVSTRPHLVTGGDVLLRVDAGDEVDLSEMRIFLDGADVSDRFRTSAHPDVPRFGAAGGSRGARSLLGLLDGLADGGHTVTASAPDAAADATLDLTSYPVSGPVISGPQQQPFVCQTEDFALAAGGTLGRPTDADCSVERRVDYVYLSTEDGEFRPYPHALEGPGASGGAGASAPTDVAEAETLHGERVPFVVRVETGTVNRAIYEIAVLHDPARPAPDPWTPSAGWNGKLVYTHGGGCRAGWHQQGDRTGGVLREGLLGMGYAVASASLNVFGQNCNDLLASETHIMVKERFVEGYGAPVYTIGTGGSGGSYQSHQTADNYPGIFDGIIVSSSFPDVTSATIFTLADARLLHRYFSEVAPDAFTREQQRVVSGFGSWGSIPNLSRGAARIDPTFEEGASPEHQGSELSLVALEERRYHPIDRPDGIRATVYDHTVNVYGVDDSTGFAARPLDNRGVQYGLAALNRGEIAVRQFLDLNRDIGGFDADLNPIPERHRADPEAARRAKETGRILYGGAGLRTTPVLDYRTYTDHREGGDIHMIVHQYSTRARLDAANGHHDNHVMNVGGRWGFTEDSPDLGVLFRQMDRWLEGILEAAPESGVSREALARRIVEAKPAGLADNCWDPEAGEGRMRTNVQEELTYGGVGRCAQLYPAYPTPRHVAGAPLANDVVTCHLKPVDPADYEVAFTEEEVRELESIFPDGVCDWSRGDVHGRGYRGTWLSFGPSPVNRVE